MVIIYNKFPEVLQNYKLTVNKFHSDVTDRNHSQLPPYSVVTIVKQSLTKHSIENTLSFHKLDSS